MQSGRSEFVAVLLVFVCAAEKAERNRIRQGAVTRGTQDGFVYPLVRGTASPSLFF